MGLTHIPRQHIYAPAPLPTFWTRGILRGVDYELFLKRLGAEIRRRRQTAKLNQIEFAAKVNTDQGSISRLENGKQGFDSPLLYRISEAFKTDPGELCAAATHTPLPEAPHPDALLIAQNWEKLQPDTHKALMTIVLLDLHAVTDAKVAETIKPAPLAATPAKVRKRLKSKR